MGNGQQWASRRDCISCKPAHRSRRLRRLVQLKHPAYPPLRPLSWLVRVVRLKLARKPLDPCLVVLNYVRVVLGSQDLRINSHREGERPAVLERSVRHGNALRQGAGTKRWQGLYGNDDRCFPRYSHHHTPLLWTNPWLRWL